MSSRQRGRGRGGRNPLAPPFQQLPLHQTPTSPDDTRMDEGQSSPVHTVPVPPSSTSSAREAEPFQEPFHYPEPRQISADLRDTNLGVRLRLTALEESFSAMQAHLMVVQQRHIDDVTALEDQVDALTSQVSTLKEQLLQYQTTTPAPRPPHLPPPPTQTRPHKATRTTPTKPPTTHQTKITATIPAATGLRKDQIWHKVILHGIPTTTTFNTVQSEIEEFNPGTHLPRPPRWLTTEAQRQDKAASAMVLTIAGKDSTEKALSRGLSLFGKKFKVQRYLTFGPDSQCTKCLAFGHHPSQCTGTQHCNICFLEHPAHLHTCEIGRAHV